MHIRHATIDDAAALARLHAASRCAAYQGLASSAYLEQISPSERAARFRSALSDRCQETWVAVDAVAITGFVTLGPARDEDLDRSRTGEIWRIYVAPEKWRRGIGAALLNLAERKLIEGGYESIVLWVLERNTAATQFYAAKGFEPDGSSKMKDLGCPQLALRYCKRLTAQARGPILPDLGGDATRR